jgi:hypothetical protein
MTVITCSITLLFVSSSQSILLFGSPIAYFAAILLGFYQFVNFVIIFKAAED